MWTTSMLKILTWILSKDPMLRKQHNILNAQFAACFKCVTTLNHTTTRINDSQTLLYSNNLLFEFFVFPMKSGTHFRLSIYLYVLWKLFRKMKNQKQQPLQENCARISISFLLLFFTETGLGWNGPLPLKFRNKN